MIDDVALFDKLAGAFFWISKLCLFSGTFFLVFKSRWERIVINKEIWQVTE